MNEHLLNREPDFDHLLRFLKRESTDRPVLFEFLIDDSHALKYSAYNRVPPDCSMDYFRMIIQAYNRLGYDYAPVYSWKTDTMSFPLAEHASALSKSQNSGAVITDEKSFEQYNWPDPAQGDLELYNRLNGELPGGMKLMACGWGGVLENVTDIVGFERLCMMYILEPDLTRRIFEQVGSRLLEYYRIVAAFDSVGFCVVNDDWGFRNQTMFPPEMMREFVYPWTRKIVEVIHGYGKPVVFHSCGNLKEIMDDVIHDLGMDAKHSFEDAIYPVEEAWDWWHDEIAIAGGIDVDYLCQHSPDEIESRATMLIEKTFDHGGYALGSGNSIAHYVPEKSLLAMISAVKKFEANLIQ